MPTWYGELPKSDDQLDKYFELIALVEQEEDVYADVINEALARQRAMQAQDGKE